MIQLLAVGLAMTGAVVGFLLLALAARRRLAGITGPRVARGDLEVLARCSVHTNQAVAVVRVGRRLMLLSCGDGGARLLVELSETDLEQQPVADPPSPPAAITAIATKAARGWRRAVAALGVAAALALGACALQAQDASVLDSDARDALRAPLTEALAPLSVQVGPEGEGLRLSGPVGTVVVLGLLALAPSLLLLTTSFTRILVVLHLLRQALGTQNTPPAHLLTGLALLLSAIVMGPTLEVVRTTALDPWLAGEVDDAAMLRMAAVPMREFMLEHTREADLVTFLQASNAPPPTTPEEISHVVLASAFVTSELRTAFEIGFAIFVPFVVIDLVVAAILTSMGMFMLPPTMIALPCKLMVFVLMDGWSLVLGTLAASFV